MGLAEKLKQERTDTPSFCIGSAENGEGTLTVSVEFSRPPQNWPWSRSLCDFHYRLGRERGSIAGTVKKVTRTVQIVVWAVAVVVGIAGTALYLMRGNHGAAAFQAVFLVVCLIGLALSIRRKQQSK